MTEVLVQRDARDHDRLSAIHATHEARHQVADALETLRDGYNQITTSLTHRYIWNGYKRMQNNRQLNATCTLLGIVGAFFMIASASHNHQTPEFNELQGIGKLFEQLGGGTSRFTEAEQTEIQGLIERLQAMKQDASQNTQEIERILGRLEELFSRETQQLSQAFTQMMRNTQ